MLRPILTLSCAAVLAFALPAQARVATLRAQEITTPVATLSQLELRLQWNAGQPAGDLQLRVGELDAPALGYHFRNLQWRCPLQRRIDGWLCDGEVLTPGQQPIRLAVVLGAESMQVDVYRGGARLRVQRDLATPELTRLDLRKVPLQWAQALFATAWADARLKAGTLDGQLAVTAADAASLRVAGPLALRALSLENTDSSIVGEGVSGDFQLDYRNAPHAAQVRLSGRLRSGEFLAGNTYVALPETGVQLQLEAHQQGSAGWQLPLVRWQDGATLQADADVRLQPDGALAALSVRANSEDMAPLKRHYLSGWLGLAGLSELELRGGMTLEAQLGTSGLQRVQAQLHGVDIQDPLGRFVFDGLNGDLRYSADAVVNSRLQWQGGQLYGLVFGPAQLPFVSQAGALSIPHTVTVPMLGGQLGLADVVIRPPQADAGMDIRFGLHLHGIDFGKVSEALGLPAFQGVLGGDIPQAHYANDRIDFDGGLALQLFDGRVAFSSLALERPFGTAPSLSADIAMDDLDLLRLTEVLGFGSISGRLDGRISGLRLVDWSPVAFDARFVTDDSSGIRQRISQRAVQNISSVGDASFITSLQGKLIGMFSDFGYRQIGIGCRLENQICTMNGLHSAGNAFTIVQGSGVPRLDVVGYNRAVDWPTLVDRLMAAGKGDVSPVID